MPVWNPHKVVRDNETKRLTAQRESNGTSSCSTMDPTTYRCYPYGYTQCTWGDKDDELIKG